MHEGGWDRLVSPASALSCFNTQPHPEGGWSQVHVAQTLVFKFQHTAARRRLGLQVLDADKFYKFKHTAARRRLAPPTSIKPPP